MFKRKCNIFFSYSLSVDSSLFAPRFGDFHFWNSLEKTTRIKHFITSLDEFFFVHVFFYILTFSHL